MLEGSPWSRQGSQVRRDEIMSRGRDFGDTELGCAVAMWTAWEARHSGPGTDGLWDMRDGS